MKVILRCMTSVLLMAVLYACSSNNVHHKNDWESYFTEQGVSGCFLLHDISTNQFYVYNLKRTQERFLPASTFKIINSLIGLETNVILDTSMVIPWDSVQRPIAAWNHDLTMGQAFRVSAVPYYQEVARRIGRPLMQQWIDSVKYGNMVLGPKIDSFWLDNSLQISPDEELGLVEELYNGKLPFVERTQRLVKSVMLMEKDSLHSLSYKTGWGFLPQKQIGWLVGWEEENKHPYFFVLNIEGADTIPHFDEIRFRIFRSIMKQEGFFKGEK